jgi:hypothetical protein
LNLRVSVRNAAPATVFGLRCLGAALQKRYINFCRFPMPGAMPLSALRLRLRRRDRFRARLNIFKNNQMNGKL